MVLLLEAVGREVCSPVCEIYIRPPFVNVQCKENAAAMHLCNKMINAQASGAAEGKKAESADIPGR
jgi:hypothetical protein